MSAIHLPDVPATIALAQRLAGVLEVGDVVCLDGPLGTGKTTLVRALVVALGGDSEQVSSPTFTLLHHYQARLPIIHVDAYRLQNIRGLESLGFDELREDGIALVEWASCVPSIYHDPACWRIDLAHAKGGGREAVVIPPIHRQGAWLHERHA